METWVWIVVIVGAVVVIGLLAWVIWAKARSTRLQQRFGPEYDRTVEQAESRQEAESELGARMKRREELSIGRLSPAAAERYTGLWQGVQARFVDQPNEAVKDADRLVSEVMQERGYPVDDFEQRAADVSVDHPQVVDNYRSAHAVWVANEQGKAETEDLRLAMVRYRSLFEELLERETAEDDRTTR